MKPIHYSEATTLAHCEQLWHYRYNSSAEKETPNRGMSLGTLFHDFLEQWWTGRYAQYRMFFSHDAEGLLDQSHDGLIDHASWLAKRYVEHYGIEPALSVESTELEFSVELGPLAIDGRVDRVARDDAGRVWVIEDKTFGSLQRLDYVSVDPQPVIYALAVEAAIGEPVQGVLWNGVYTKQWKPEMPTQAKLIEESGLSFPTKKAATEWAREQLKSHPGTERPAHESFHRLWLDPSVEQRQQAFYWLLAADQRRFALSTWAEEPIRNIGQRCKSCFYRNECHAEFTGFDPDEIELVDE